MGGTETLMREKDPEYCAAFNKALARLQSMDQTSEHVVKRTMATTLQLEDVVPKLKRRRQKYLDCDIGVTKFSKKVSGSASILEIPHSTTGRLRKKKRSCKHGHPFLPPQFTAREKIAVFISAV
jgi:hypothetical protein